MLFFANLRVIYGCIVIEKNQEWIFSIFRYPVKDDSKLSGGLGQPLTRETGNFGAIFYRRKCICKAGITVFPRPKDTSRSR